MTTLEMNFTTDVPETYYEYDETIIPICNRDADNLLGAHLSYLYYFMFAFSLLGNGLVLLIIFRFEKLTTVTNIILLNLVVSDQIFMSSLPFWGVYQQQLSWPFGNALCKLVGSTYFLGFYSSVLFLTLLTFDRHLAVVYPLSATRLRGRRYAVVSCTAVWLISCLACMKPMVLYAVFTDFTGTWFCEEYTMHVTPFVVFLKSSGKYVQLFLFFLFPLFVIVYCYARITMAVISAKTANRFRTVRLIFVIVLLFFVCWAPYNIVLLMHGHTTTCEQSQDLGYALHVTSNIAYFYFCVSPIFYTFVGKKFQYYFRQLLVNRFPSVKVHWAGSETSILNLSMKGATNETTPL